MLFQHFQAFSRRRRPAYNNSDMFATMSVDKFSFPSGHSTRAVALGLFFVHLHPLGVVLSLPVLAWSAAVCVSRVLLGRHHILDVLGGTVVGVVEVVVLSALWIGEESSEYFTKYVFNSEDPWSSA